MKPEFIRQVIDGGVILKEWCVCIMGYRQYYTTIHPYFSKSTKKPWKFVNGELTQNY